MRLRPRLFIGPLTVGLCLLGAGSAQAADIFVTNTNSSGAGSLSAAITTANGDGVQDTIKFQLGAGPYKILTSAVPLPEIIQPVVIDGYSQTGSSPNTNPLGGGDNAVLKVEISGRTGLVLRAGNSTIKGLVLNSGDGTGSGGAGGGGVGIDSRGSNNVIEGNFIGTLPDGVTATTAQRYLEGIELGGAVGDTGNRIGGSAAAARNVIAGNMSEGIRLSAVFGAGGGSKNTTIQGNYIGTTKDGTAAPAGSDMTDGIRVYGGNTGTVIGGSGAGEGNLISGLSNPGLGIGLLLQSDTDAGSSTGTIKGNLIGTQRDGTSPLGNSNAGLLIGAREWVIGGTGAGERNVIAYNGIGVRIDGSNDLNGGGDRNRITANSIHSNTLLGIDLRSGGALGVSQNDTINPDIDNGPNEEQNFPVLSSASLAGGIATLSGTLPSRPGKTYRIEFFANPSCHAAAPNDYGEGRTYLGFTDVTTDGSGNASFANVQMPGVPAGQAVFSATATDPDGNTSEFSQCKSAGGAPPPAQCDDGIDNDGDGKVDFPADLGCTSTSDDSESPDPSTPGGGGTVSPPASASPSTPSTPVVPNAPLQPSSFNALGTTQCSRRAISLIRADTRGGNVVLSGLVGAGLAKGKVSVKGNYKVKGKRVTATVTADAKGQFTAKLKRPPAKGFAAARYTATSGSAKSIELRLTQSLASRSIRQQGAGITVAGKVKKSLLGKRNPVVIKRLVCGKYRKVGSAKPKADGSYAVTFAAPGLAGAALYRAESVVLARPGARKYVIQYARAISITLTGQTG